MFLVAYEFTSDSSRALEKSMRGNQSNFAFRNIVALRFNNEFLVSDAKIPFKNSFTSNDHTIFHSTNTNIWDTNKTITQGWYGKAPESKNNWKAVTEDGYIIIDIYSDASVTINR